jgi:hypothetical protein
MNLPSRMCLNKQAYDSKEQASRVLQDVMAMNESLDLNIYRCPLCSKFHLGRKTRRRR